MAVHRSPAYFFTTSACWHCHGRTASWCYYLLTALPVSPKHYALPLPELLRPGFGSNHRCKRRLRLIPPYITRSQSTARPRTTRLSLRIYHMTNYSSSEILGCRVRQIEGSKWFLFGICVINIWTKNRLKHIQIMCSTHANRTIQLN